MYIYIYVYTLYKFSSYNAIRFDPRVCLEIYRWICRKSILFINRRSISRDSLLLEIKELKLFFEKRIGFDIFQSRSLSLSQVGQATSIRLAALRRSWSRYHRYYVRLILREGGKFPGCIKLSINPSRVQENTRAATTARASVRSLLP